MMAVDAIPLSVTKLLWDVFCQRVPGTTDAQSRGALVVLGMAAHVQPDVVRENVSVLVATGLGKRIFKRCCLYSQFLIVLLCISTKPNGLLIL